MRFSFYEAELINDFFEDVEIISGKKTVIDELEKAILNTKEHELIEVAESTIQKIKTMDETTFNKVFSDRPLDTYTIY